MRSSFGDRGPVLKGKLNHVAVTQKTLHLISKLKTLSARIHTDRKAKPHCSDRESILFDIQTKNTFRTNTYCIGCQKVKFMDTLHKTQNKVEHIKNNYSNLGSPRDRKENTNLLQSTPFKIQVVRTSYLVLMGT